MKKIQKWTVILVAALMIIIAGCSSAKPPKEALQAAMTKIAEADSYAMTMSLGVDELELAPAAALQTDIATAAIIGMIKDATIKVDAVYKKDPMRTDMNLEIVLPGDMEMKLKVPMIMTKEILYVKIPEIPMLGLPSTITGKFIKIDLKELAAQQGGAQIDIAAQKKLSNEIGSVLLKHFDEKTYFSEPKAEEAGLPADLKADQIISFEINEGNYGKTVETVINQVVPEVLDILLANADALKSLNLEKANIEKAKADLESNKAKMLDMMKNDVKVNKLKATGAIKDGYLVYQAAQVNVHATEKESGQNMKVGFHFNVSYSDINKAANFENEIPADAITMEQVMQLFKTPVGL